MRNYLSSHSLLTLQEKKEAFKIRTRMTETKTNFKNKYDEYNCVACEKKNQIHEETQEHIYFCKNINENKGIFTNIFDNKQETKLMKEITKDYLANMKQRRKLLPD